MTKSAVPRTTSSMPRVTRNEGIFRRVTNSPLNSPISAATTRLIKNATFSDVRPGIEQRPHDDGRKSKQRPDGQIEFSRRHQKRHRQRDETEFDGEG